MFEKRLNKKDLEELRKKGEIVDQQLVIIEALKFQMQVRVQQLLPKYGVDMDKNHEVDFRSGKIKLVKGKQK